MPVIAPNINRPEELENNIFVIRYDKVSNDLDVTRKKEKDYIVVNADWTAEDGSEGFIKNKPENLAYIKDLTWEHGRAGNGSVQLRRSLSYAEGNYSVAEGYDSISFGNYSHSEGLRNRSHGIATHTEGVSVSAMGDYSHAEGGRTEANASYAHAEGYHTYANGVASHSEGLETISRGTYSHAEGKYTQAEGQASHAEGSNTQASGKYAHAEGRYSVASGDFSHASGNYTQANNAYEFTLGHYSKSYDGVDNHLQYKEKNIKSGPSIFTIGNGEDGNRRNILAIHENGNSIKTMGSSYFIDEVYAPVSYSYVESLGPTAYLTTILSAILDPPQYTKPTVTMDKAGTNTTTVVGSVINQTIKFNASHVAPNYNDIDEKYGTELGNRLGYSTAITLINYSYLHYDDDVNNYNLIIKTGTYTNERTGNTINNGTVNNYNKPVTAKIDGLTFEEKLNKINNSDLFDGSLANVSTSIKLNDKFILNREGVYELAYMTSYTYTGATQMYFQQLAQKGTYIPNDGISPTEKFSPSDDNELVYTEDEDSIKIWKYTAVHKIYYGVLNDNNIKGLKLYDKGEVIGLASYNLPVINFNSSDYGVNGSKNHYNVLNAPKEYPVTVSGISGSPKTFWVAVPSDEKDIDDTYTDESFEHMVREEQMANSDKTSNNYKNYINNYDGKTRCAVRLEKLDRDNYINITTTASSQNLDTGITSKDAMPLRKIRTKNIVQTPDGNSTDMYYDIYYVNGSGSIPTGTISFILNRIW